MTNEERKRLITWGVNGHGDKFYLCDCCGEKFGYVDFYEINHKCKEVKK
tara:strand:- start:438 stop:584 length:147 start_codon:yes stop_codon:yes gene_type:complete